MEEFVNEDPVNPNPVTNLKSNPPSPKPSPKKLVVRNVSSRLKSRKSSTPYPSKSHGSTKRTILSSIPESKLVRKKIAFDSPTHSPAEENEDVQVDVTGSSPDGDTAMATAPEEHLHPEHTRFTSEFEQVGFSKSSPSELRPEAQIADGNKEDVGDGNDSTICQLKMTVVQVVQPIPPACLAPTEGYVGASACDSPNGNKSNLLLQKQTSFHPLPENCNITPNLMARPLTDAKRDLNSDFPALTEGRSPVISVMLQEHALIRDGTKDEFSPSPSATTTDTNGGLKTGAPSMTVHEMPENAWLKAGIPQNPLARTGAATTMGNRAPEPVAFDLKNIKELGTAGVSEGIPSISFSSSDTEFLAKKLGHAIVGKFSHSIPTPHHIQKALGNIKFVGSFSWKYMNAKHILIQFDDLTDYARLLNGPNGAPVWYVDKHPMRVFKWTPEFDPFFESPIAAIWCNLIGLPIHLYEPSALFAIGRLLGNPIQADHATINQSRLSFARICVEIDISDPPPEEILLDLLGKEIRQKVVWDRIPLYCSECKHIGHVRESCYAFGKKTKPEKKDYTSANQPSRPPNIPRRVNQVWQPRVTKEATSTSNMFASLARMKEADKVMQGIEKEDGTLRMAQPPNQRQDQEDNDGFQLVVRRKGKNKHHISPSGQGSGANGGTTLIVGAKRKQEATPRQPPSEDYDMSESEDEVMIEEVEPGGQLTG